MTVLVMDHPDLMSRFALLSAGPDEGVSATEAKPHRLRFHYGFNRHQPNDEDLAFLRRHGAYLRDHPSAQVRLHGHTDNFGSESYNLFLSRQRATCAARIMLEAGARESQLSIEAWGSDCPLTLPEDHGANRRLELEYLDLTMAQAL